MTSDRALRAAREVERACAGATSLVDLCRSVHTAIEPMIPADRWCSFALDPATLVGTNGYHDEGVDVSYLPRLLELEYGEADATQIPALARTATGVATISEATGGDPASSARWREIIEPSGLSHELRAVFRDGRQSWGALVLFRAPDVADFGSEETSFMQRIAPVVAAGFRGVLVRQHIDYGDDAREAGIIVLGGEPLEVRTATNAARFWLDQLDDSGAGSLPTAVLSAARGARARGRVIAVRARTRTGRWLTITAEATDDRQPGASDVGVVVQPSRPAEIAQILGAAHGLTGREREIVLLLACGNTNQEIAGQLNLSRYTVADHLKSIFTKLDVVTRGELTSKLFFDYYLPRAMNGRPAGTDGWFLPD